MKNLIFNKFIIDATKTFFMITASVGLIVWVIQAVKFLDFVAEDGHSLKVYFLYTLLNLPKIIHRILPFVFFISLFHQINQYELKNELLVLWSNGINKISFIKAVIIYSLLVTIFQLILGLFISPLSQDKGRDFIRQSNIDFLPSLIKAGKFIDTVSDLTIFIDHKDELGNLKNIYLKDSSNDLREIDDGFQIIFAKNGRLYVENKIRFFKLFNGNIINNNNGELTNFKFRQLNFNLEKYSSKTTVFPKIQEISTNELLKCIYSFNSKEQIEYISSRLMCNETKIKDITQEFLKRLYKPIYIPLIGLIVSLIILKSREVKTYYKYSFFIFFITFSLILISELSLRYSTINLSGFLFFIFFPLLLFIISYLLLTIKFKNKL
ncbi:LptF/LptG family permease [Candidatus Pelagibacter sp. Uisw_134_02]|uniref:LptF/LptG family permease n=1 Tax=Candidatus Pelagibacter sp. Uisw_134_02 TaxID=3230990 RepID=UPI0039EC34B6